MAGRAAEGVRAGAVPPHDATPTRSPTHAATARIARRMVLVSMAEHLTSSSREGGGRPRLLASERHDIADVDAETGHRAYEPGVTESEHPAVVAHHPVAPAL